MSCAPTYHEAALSTLFGTAATPPTTETICAPDAQRSCSGLFDCAADALSAVQGGQVALATAQSAATLASFYTSGGLSVVPTILGDVGSVENIPQLNQAAQAVGAFAAADSLSTLDLILGGSSMGLFDSLDSFSLGDFTSGLADQINWGDVLNTGVQLGVSALSQPSAVPVMAKVPQVIPALPSVGGAVARAGAAVGRKFFDKWPNLAVGLQKLKNAGQNVNRAKLYSMLKRFGPDFLISAGILTAAAVSELAMAGPGHRRMNPANSKALRRAARRIKGFHKLCSHSDLIKTHRRAPSRGACGSCGKYGRCGCK